MLSKNRYLREESLYVFKLKSQTWIVLWNDAFLLKKCDYKKNAMALILAPFAVFAIWSGPD